MSYEVGQIVYLLINDEMKIVPVQVVEQVVRKRFNEDTEVSYIVLLPNKNRGTANMADLNATVHVDLNTLRDFMLNNAIQSIDRMLMRARTTAQSYFSAGDPVRENQDEVK